MEPAIKGELGVGFSVTFTRSFAAPRALVFRLWTDPPHPHRHAGKRLTPQWRAMR
jgi:uncharacterized protein YndB with AHSA1/START domain